MGTTQQGKYYQAIEYIFFFGLCGVSVYFMYGVLDKFFSEKTSISQSEVPVKDLPSIVLCFDKPSSRLKEYEYASDFGIIYFIADDIWTFHESLVLKEGENLTLLDEAINLEKITTFAVPCYKISSMLSTKYMVKTETTISVYFIDSIPEKDLPTSLKVYISSEENSYGIIYKEWMHGNILKTHVDKGKSKDVKLKPIQRNNLPCGHESYYECGSRILEAGLSGSSSQCSTYSLPSYPVCKFNKTEEEWQEFFNAEVKYHDECIKLPKVCVTLEYVQIETFKEELVDTNISFKFSYEIPSNSTTLFEEYYICDAVNAIGSVGGTLGMFIGFSFTGLISFLMTILKNVISIIRANTSTSSLNNSFKHIQKVEDNGKIIALAQYPNKDDVYFKGRLEEEAIYHKIQILLQAHENRIQNLEKRIEN